MADFEPLADGREAILGVHFLAMQTAVAALHQQSQDLTTCKVLVARQGESLVVLFVGLTKMTGERQDRGVRLDPNMELSAQEVQAFLAGIDKLEVLDTVHGQNYLAISTAAREFQRKRERDLAEYKITVVRERGMLTVMFVDKERKPGARGGGGRIPGFEAKLDPRDLQVLKSHFLR